MSKYPWLVYTSINNENHLCSHYKIFYAANVLSCLQHEVLMHMPFPKSLEVAKRLDELRSDFLQLLTHNNIMM